MHQPRAEPEQDQRKDREQWLEPMRDGDPETQLADRLGAARDVLRSVQDPGDGERRDCDRDVEEQDDVDEVHGALRSSAETMNPRCTDYKPAHRGCTANARQIYAILALNASAILP